MNIVALYKTSSTVFDNSLWHKALLLEVQFISVSSKFLSQLFLITTQSVLMSNNFLYQLFPKMHNTIFLFLWFSLSLMETNLIDSFLHILRHFIFCTGGKTVEERSILSSKSKVEDVLIFICIIFMKAFFFFFSSSQYWALLHKYLS